MKQETQAAIKHYVFQKSRGLLTLDDNDADTIIDIVRGRTGQAEFYKYDVRNDSYIKVQTILATDDRIREILERSKQMPEVKGFARYDLYNSMGVMVGRVYTLNSDLL